MTGERQRWWSQGKMVPESEKVGSYLHTLCIDITNRRVGSK